MLTCPVCGASRNSADTTCSRCSADLTLLIHIEDQATAFYNEALEFAKTGSVEDAITRLNAALAVDPNHVDSLVVLGKLLAQQGDYNAAIQVWQKALAQTSEGSPAWTKATRGIDKANALLARRGAEQAKHVRNLRVLSVCAGIGLFALGGVMRGVSGQLAGHPTKVAPPPVATVDVQPSQDATKSLVTSLNTLPTVLQGADPDAIGDLRAAQIKVQPGDAGTLRLEGTVPTAHTRNLVVSLLKTLAPHNQVDASKLRVVDEYGTYTVDSRDADIICDDTIAKHFCGDSRSWKEIMHFNALHENELRDPYALREGTRIRIPWRLLQPVYTGQSVLSWKSKRSP